MKNLSKEYLIESSILDFSHPNIQALIEQRKWRKLPAFEAIGAVYNYVRDEIKFGYNADDRLPASQVLNDGYGQCNTKGTLLIALLRAVNIPTRIHGFTISNDLQRGAIPHYLFFFAPKRILHSWVEVNYNNRWINLEGYILDKAYLQKIQERFAEKNKDFSGYAIATKCLSEPSIDWIGKDTYIQKEGIADDLGKYKQPDEFYSKYGTNLSGIKKVLFCYLLRHLMNFNVKQIRDKGAEVKIKTLLNIQDK